MGPLGAPEFSFPNVDMGEMAYTRSAETPREDFSVAADVL